VAEQEEAARLHQGQAFFALRDEALIRPHHNTGTRFPENGNSLLSDLA
jgi:hypothetical protein